MAWRIGDIIDIHEQLEWIHQAGFDGVGFHASAGIAGHWRGVDPNAADKETRKRLREQIARFAMCEVHAPFAYELAGESLHAKAKSLIPILDFAGDVGASIVTIHADLPTSRSAETCAVWQEVMQGLNSQAAANQVVIGLEMVRGFDWISAWHLSHIGVTLDVGHMYVIDQGEHLKPFGMLGDVIRHIDRGLVHLHVHDYNGVLDHIEVGTGCVDFHGMLQALKDIHYQGGMCLEMNPERVAPDGIKRSAGWLRQHLGKLIE
ncbi:MAG: sugar phosphate isomerase/epimerase [Verrucomicrobia bacterium]|nr:sugar phosphate isomerase/epimerase [Verrucomicrobiota bacterium]MBU4247211.1 sugar phosphate isomerase/epimerase [Verrucomicrobiota bacterium]MBU4498288.1 sugar phosphate isomerase/epimerase [Verrucomicrobiota bacterium]